MLVSTAASFSEVFLSYRSLQTIIHDWKQLLMGNESHEKNLLILVTCLYRHHTHTRLTERNIQKKE